MVQFNGHFDGSVITPDEQVDIPLNVPLRVTIEPAAAPEATGESLSWLLELAKKYAIEGPPDLAENHDYYAHGKPIE
jgi:hypothetical protein